MRDALVLLTTFGRRGGGGRIHAGSLPWFPLVGAGLGLAAGAAWWGAQQWWPRPVAAGLVLLVDAACTGLLHYDGLADAADGLLPHADRPRRLAIMRTPDVGAFGVCAVGSSSCSRPPRSRPGLRMCFCSLRSGARRAR